MDTIAMIGSPASRGAVASVGGGGRACPAAASAVSAARGAIAASVTMVGGPQRRIATVDCAVVNRFTMPTPVELPVRACVDQVSDRDFWINKPPPASTPPIRSLGLSARSGGNSLIHDSPPRRKGGSRLQLARNGHADSVAQCPLLGCRGKAETICSH